MIEIKIASEEELHLLKKTFENPPSQNDSDFCMVVKDGEKILGYSNGIIPNENLAVITNLYIHPIERGMNLGDGLLRSTFNTLELKGFRWVLIEGRSELKGFLAHEELSPLDSTIPVELTQAIEVWDKDLDRGKYFYCEPKEFFSRKCKGSRRK